MRFSNTKSRPMTEDEKKDFIESEKALERRMVKQRRQDIKVVKAYEKILKNKKRSQSPSKSVSSVSVESVKPPTKRKINALIRKIPDDTYSEKVIHKIVDKIRSGEYTSISDFPKPSKTGPKSKIVLK